jgi:tRNA threonylcarbamoyl adenosine modification protein YeaZ
MSSLILLVDTSLKGASVGLVDVTKQGAECLVWSASEAVSQESARQLPLLIQSGLDQLGLEMNAVCSILVGLGPGSFTGLRVGMAYLLGLSLGHQATILWRGVSSLQLMTQNLAKLNDRPSAIGLSATQSTGYLSIAYPDKSEQDRLMAIDMTRADANVAVTMDLDVYTVDTWPLFERQWPADAVKSLSTMHISPLLIDLMAHDAIRSWSHGFSKQIPELIYLRKSSAEERVHS